MGCLPPTRPAIGQEPAAALRRVVEAGQAEAVRASVDQKAATTSLPS